MKKMTKIIALSGIALTVANSHALVTIGGAGSGGVGYEYRISETEVSYDEWKGSGLAGGSTYTNTLGGAAPAVDISWNDAARYCNYLTSGDVNTGAYGVSGGVVQTLTPHQGAAMDALVSTYETVYVLPTYEEWRKAAYWDGSKFSLYANGSDDTAPVNGVDARYSFGSGTLPPTTDPWLVSQGTLEQNGTRNMSGNVWEWQETTDPNNASKVTFNGGDWFLGESFIRSDVDSSDVRDPAYNIGMRVVAIPEPSTLGLMALFSGGVLVVRRRFMM